MVFSTLGAGLQEVNFLLANAIMVTGALLAIFLTTGLVRYFMNGRGAVTITRYENVARYAPTFAERVLRCVAQGMNSDDAVAKRLGCNPRRVVAEVEELCQPPRAFVALGSNSGGAVGYLLTEAGWRRVEALFGIRPPPMSVAAADVADAPVIPFQPYAGATVQVVDTGRGVSRALRDGETEPGTGGYVIVRGSRRA